MKKLSLVASMVLLSCTCFSQSGFWTVLNSGTTANLLGISAPSAKICYVSGMNGTIRKSSDGGNHWHSQASGTTESLYAVRFTDIDHGIAVGDNGAAVITANGGINWTPVALTNSLNCRCIYYLNSTTAYIGGGITVSHGMIYKTTDGGLTWTGQNMPSSIYGIRFTSPLIGYANSYLGMIFQTTDGGLTWNTISTGSDPLNGSEYFTGSAEGFITGMNGAIQYTNDAGTSWSPVSTGTADAFTGIDFRNATDGFAVGGDVAGNTGQILFTTDNGNSWSSYFPNTSRLYRVDFYDADLGYVCGLDGTILRYKPVTVTAVAEEDAGLINIYPNPAAERVYIDINNVSFTDSPLIELSDVSGKIIFRKKYERENTIVIERGDIKAGIYIVKVSDGAVLKKVERLILQ